MDDAAPPFPGPSVWGPIATGECIPQGRTVHRVNDAQGVSAPDQDMSYPTSVELTPGSMLTIYWYTGFDRYFLAGTFWQIPPSAK